MRVPSATYRLQFNAGFRFDDAGRVLAYLRDLGISDVYASPLLKARRGSIHGYDVTDPTAINPEIGTREEFERLSHRLRENRLGLLLDFVPNHMAASVENPWWYDVLAKGQTSAYAEFFDIDWSDRKVLLPVLGKPYGDCLDSREISIRNGNGSPVLKYGEQEFPVRAATLEGAPDADAVDRIVARQPYRLAYWRKAADSINYRRFFDINDLVGLRIERLDVFNAVHSAVLELVRRGAVSGLRIDHIDGLIDPKAYLDRLPDTYILVEKILGGRETLPLDWKTQGTTGYDFLNIVNGVFVDPGGYDELCRIYSEFTGLRSPQVMVFRARKRQAIKQLFWAETVALTERLAALAQPHRNARDLTRREIQEALISVTASLPVYRTYIRSFTIDDSDRRHIEHALHAAGCRPLCGALEFLREVLLIDPPYYLGDCRGDYLEFVMRWQQFTGPVMAKGLEDTTFYVHNPLIALNEVGGDCCNPSVYFGVDEFHRRNGDRRRRQPFTMNVGSTHDTKRSEDVRCRIDVLSEMPAEWRRHLKRWNRWNPSESAPDRNEQVFIYQTLLGAWPISRDRLHPYLIKALREAKTNTNWLHPDENYERQVLAFVDRIVDPQQSERFLKDFLRLRNKVAYYGALNSLSQTLLKIASPGLPDFYQGTEMWDFSLADPDNRRPVDFQTRIDALENLKRHARVKEMLRHWEDGRIKMFVIWKALTFRGENVDLFLEGDYIPVETTGPRSENVVAFARRLENRWCIVAVPRLFSKLTPAGKPPLGHRVWSNTSLLLPPDCPAQFMNIFTDKPLAASACAEVFSDFPLALLYSTGAS